ncbi:hypothetical protein ANCCAN_02715 [Ancylostoma caninum]|uniref:Glycosyltransferase family 92 protein n=1 Tax=Ancylostoma caninum TaxID=29170 RepID=A0A368H748_ANCCA|nr:hypothetical protein ANCCAN_02715 [Ancylostoma caninum]
MHELGEPFKSVVFPEYNVHCLPREGAVFMSLSDTPTEIHEYPVAITDRTQAEPTHFFSVCLSPLYGKEPKWLLLAELVEHYKLQGATFFYLYTKYIDKYSKTLLHDYVRTGEAEVIVLDDRIQRIDAFSRYWHFLELQECLTRARGHSKWVAFIDLDERITPTEYPGTLSDYLMNIMDEKIGGILFRQRWILRDEKLPLKYTDEEQVATWMPTWRYHNTSHVGPPGNTAKFVIDPKKALIVNIHFVEKFFEGYSMYEMKPSEGVVRHYRDVNAGQWGQIWLKRVEEMGEFSLTNYPAKWMDSLRLNIQRRLHYVYGGQH